MRIRLEPVTIEGVEDGEGMLAFLEDRLAAVLVRLSTGHGTDSRHWFVEKGFGLLDRPALPIFKTLDDACEWLKSELADHVGGTPGH